MKNELLPSYSIDHLFIGNVYQKSISTYGPIRGGAGHLL